MVIKRLQLPLCFRKYEQDPTDHDNQRQNKNTRRLQRHRIASLDRKQRLETEFHGCELPSEYGPSRFGRGQPLCNNKYLNKITMHDHKSTI